MAAWRYSGVVLLLACALAVGLWSGNALRYSDEAEYHQLAQSLLHQHTFANVRGHVTIDRPPGYPAVIAAVYLLSEQPLAVKIANALFLALAALLLGELAKRLDPRGETRVSTLVPYFVLLYPLLTYSSSLLYPQILACLLFTATVLLISSDRPRSGGMLLAGIAYGILILTVPYFLALLPLLAACIVIGSSVPKRTAISRALLMILVCVLVVMPWTIRNYVVSGAFVPVSTNQGYNLYTGNSPETGPNSGTNVPVRKLCKYAQRGLSDPELDAAFGRCAVEWIRANPQAAARLYVSKVVNYFNYRNEIATPGENASWRDWVVFGTYYPLLLIALLRAALLRRYPLNRTEALIYVLYFLNALVSAIWFTRLRFRIPFDFLLIAVDAAFVCKCWDYWRAARISKPYPRARQSAES